MDLESVFDELPFVRHLGIEIESVEEGHAEGRLPLREEHSSNPASTVANGGVTYSLADTVGGAAVVSLTGQPSPAVDMRIDYLAPATTSPTRQGSTSPPAATGPRPGRRDILAVVDPGSPTGRSVPASPRWPPGSGGPWGATG